MGSRRYVILDVFTQNSLTGNPLAVVLDSDGLNDQDMQAIAQEFNLSETVFVLPDTSGRKRAQLRIFTPGMELPFAGHPTVGTAFLLASIDQQGQPGSVAFGLDEKIGTINCAVDVESAEKGFARFRLPQHAERWGEGRDIAACAWALGLEPKDIGFDRHEPSRYTAGVTYDFIPVVSVEALSRIKINNEAFDKVFGDDGRGSIYAYSRDGSGTDRRFRARMFTTGMGFSEDPATGSAVAAFTGALMQFEPMGDGKHNFAIGQGFEMGRPSELALEMVLENGAVSYSEIGGYAVVTARGELVL
ncbi:PhzF family phenazine biosynthesis protein [Microvirga sp. W0021]|uniref:PhzF family phenazine biosynthesis protein n=1 Tax=Hohaiivirga grylli TaxID=3133970 RepID=A0ABV0BL77_9HYPH